jgi:hypothetical protein
LELALASDLFKKGSAFFSSQPRSIPAGWFSDSYREVLRSNSTDAAEDQLFALLFRSSANWALAHSNFFVRRQRAIDSIRRLRSGPISARPVFTPSLFSEIPEKCKSCLIHISQTVIQNKKYFI